MEIIQTFIEKYGGVYHEEQESSAHSPIGKFTSQEKRGRVLYKGNKLTVFINEVGGANPVAELFRMKLIHENSFDTEILMFPRSYWSIKFRRWFLSKRNTLAEAIHQQYKFTGSRELISKLKQNSTFLKKIDGEYVCINIPKKTPNIIIITPSHGYRSVEHLEKLAETLVLVKSSILDSPNGI